MSLVPTSYDDLIKNATNRFPKPVLASVSWGDSDAPGLHIECMELLREFVGNGVEFGKGTQGLFFNIPSGDFFPQIEVSYKVSYNEESKRTIMVDFYNVLSDPSPFATFLTRDDSVQVSALRDGRGIWRDLEIGTSTARVHKLSEQKTVMLIMVPIGKKVAFAINDDLHRAENAIRGIFYFPSLVDLYGNDCIVKYNDSRIVFYSSTHKTKMLGVLYPTEGGHLGIDDHGSTDPPIAVWENL